ncbi:hypothetical protein, partial [Aeromicrobium sp.]|uniref:hypothetical protein n=1 Tax=Aeromicrobium sp. TaxID=1871063 RepID=UPI0028A61405
TVLSNSQGGSSGVSGGGASYVAPAIAGAAATDIASSAGPKRNGSGVGADGSVSLTWVPCDYDLGVVKSAEGPAQDTGLTTWTVAVTNNGPDDMAIGDTVTLTDTLPGTATTITSLVAPAGVTCRADGTPLAVGDPMASPVECARADGSGLDDGESITFTYTQTLTAVGNYVNNAAVTDRSTVTNNNTSTDNARVTGPTTDDGTSEGRRGKPQQWSPTPERGTFPVDCEETLTLLDADGDPVTELVVAGVGTYTVDACAIVFTPVLAFQGTPEAPVRYRVTDSQGNPATGTYNPTVLPADPPSTNAGTTSGPQGVAQS